MNLKYYQHTILIIFILILSLILAARLQHRYQIQMHFTMQKTGP